jgi:tRNA G10  N-methylase Trm11
VGQTGRPLRVRFQEHFQDCKYANKSKFSAHLLENKHSIGHIEDIMEVLHITNKGLSWTQWRNFTSTKEQVRIFRSMIKHHKTKHNIRGNSSRRHQQRAHCPIATYHPLTNQSVPTSARLHIGHNRTTISRKQFNRTLLN